MMCAPAQRLGRGHRGERPLVALLSLLCLAIAPPSFAQEDFSEVVLFASANGLTKPCGFVTRATGGNPAFANDDFSVTSAPSTLYRVEPETGVATLVGPIQDPNLAGRVVKAGQTGTESSSSEFNYITLDSSEQIVDVCGLTPSADGRLLGSATLQNSRVHVLIEIDPGTGEAHLIDGLNINLGVYDDGPLDFDNSADATTCLVSDLEFNASQNHAIGVAQCFFTDKVSPRQIPLAPAVPPNQPSGWTVFARINPDTADSASPQHVSVARIPEINDLGSFTPATLARRPSDGKLSGSILSVYLHYESDGTLDGQAQVDNGLLDPTQTAVLGLRVAANRAYWPLITSTGETRYQGTFLVNGTTAMTYSPGGQLYRSYLQGNLLGGVLTGLSHLEKISVSDGTPMPAPNAVPITDGGSTVLGVQAITFMPFANEDGAVSGGTPLDELLACPLNPRATSDCNVETFEPNSKLKYDAKNGKLYFKARRGNRKTLADFGSPRTETKYAMCVYGGTNNGDSVASLISARQIPPSTLWKQKKKGVKYKAGDPKTRVRLKLRKRQDVKVKFKGRAMPFPQQPTDDLGVTVQLITDEGECWHGGFPNGTFLKNGVQKFKARAY